MKLASGLILDQGLSSWTYVFFGMELSALGTFSGSAALPLAGLVASFSVLSSSGGVGTSFSVTWLESFVSAELFLRSYLL